MADRLNCSYSPSEITADSDIVGPGVLAAYFITAVTTILTVIGAYLFGGLDDSYMIELDYEVMAAARRRWSHLKRRHTDLASATNIESDAVKKARTAAVTQFVLALSDQQLVTGLAILIAGLSNLRRITGYELAIVISLAWFSSTTHLTTLIALRTYMDSHGVVRDARVVGMVVILILMGFLLFLLPGTVRGGFTRPAQCAFENGFGALLPLSWAVTLMVLLKLAIGYTLRIQDLYFHETHPSFFPMLFVMRWLRVHTDGLSHKELFTEIVSEQRLQHILAASKATGYKRAWNSLRLQYNESFLRSLPGIGLSFSYGLCQIVACRWMFAPALTPESNIIGFGQIVPILLLLLPALAAGEALYDFRNERHQEERLLEQNKPQNNANTVSTSGPQQQNQDGVSEDLVADGRRFDNKTTEIKRYFYQEVRMRVLHGPKDNDLEMLRRKSALLKKYDQVVRFERGIDMRLAKVRFWTDLVLSVMLGIFLNIGSTVAMSAAGSAVYVVVVAFDLGTALEDALDLYKCLSSRRRPLEDHSNNANNGPQSTRPKESQNSLDIPLEDLNHS